MAKRFRMIENAELRVQEFLIARGDDIWGSKTTRASASRSRTSC
jgi:hypothetical protein